MSVFVISYNEADRIGSVLAAVKGLASEIVVVDSGSNDATCSVASAAGARVIFNSWQGYGPQKRFAEDQCKGPWLLNLDADEVVSSELATELRALFERGEPELPAYRLRIAEQFPGERRPHRFAYTLTPVRLYRKDAGRYSSSPVHDRVELRPEARAGLLKARVYHRSVRSLSHQISKLNFYSDMQVADMDERRRHIPAYRILYEMPVTFVKVYLLRRHFLRGFYGVATAMNIAIARHLRVAKVIEMQRVRRLEEVDGIDKVGTSEKSAAGIAGHRQVAPSGQSGAREYLAGRLFADGINPASSVLSKSRLRTGWKAKAQAEGKMPLPALSHSSPETPGTTAYRSKR